MLEEANALFYCSSSGGNFNCCRSLQNEAIWSCFTTLYSFPFAISCLCPTEIKQIWENKSSHAPQECKCVPPDMRVTCNRSQLGSHRTGPQIFQGNDKQTQWDPRYICHHFCMDLDHRGLPSSHMGGLQNRQCEPLLSKLLELYLLFKSYEWMTIKWIATSREMI